MGMRRARRTATAALLATALAWTGPAAAKTDTLAKGAMNLVGTPLDIALTPYTASSTFVRKVYLTKKQSTMQKVLLTPIMGVAYAASCTVITGAVAALRFTDGLLNVPLGLAVLPTNIEPETSIYEPVHGAHGALVDTHGVYFGGYHCEGFFQ